MSPSCALLWLTHVWAPELAVEFEKLCSLKGPDVPHVWLLLDSRTTGATSLAERYPRCHVFEEKRLFQLPYPRLEGHGLINHPHFPVFDFFLSHGNYENYWVIEYDVRYTGRWETLLSSFQSYDHDLVTSHIRRYAQEPSWFWWDTLHHPTKEIVRTRYVRSFNVIYRISNRALEFMHQAQSDGWRGYAEVSFPTLLLDGGFRLLDFGGKGEFTLPEYRNRFYTTHSSRSGNLGLFGTMRYRPSRARAGMRKNKIYHPVKPEAMIEPARERLKIMGRWALEMITGSIILRNRNKIGFSGVWDVRESSSI
jgi:hypothetical protein